jgi:hypothetical protein
MTVSQHDPLLAKTGLTKIERDLRASVAADIMWGQCEDRTARTANARRAADKKFEDQADPDHVLLPKERAKQAENLRRAHLKQMALKSAKNRRLREAKARQPGEASQP